MLIKFNELEPLRQEFNLTDDEMANLVGLSITSYRRIEQGKIPFRYVNRISATYVAFVLRHKQDPFTREPKELQPSVKAV